MASEFCLFEEVTQAGGRQLPGHRILHHLYPLRQRPQNLAAVEDTPHVRSPPTPARLQDSLSNGKSTHSTLELRLRRPGCEISFCPLRTESKENEKSTHSKSDPRLRRLGSKIASSLHHLNCFHTFQKPMLSEYETSRFDGVSSIPRLRQPGRKTLAPPLVHDSSTESEEYQRRVCSCRKSKRKLQKVLGFEVSV